MRQNPHVRIYGGCALKAREAQAPEMATAARPSLGGHPKPAINGHLKTGHHR